MYASSKDELHRPSPSEIPVSHYERARLQPDRYLARERRLLLLKLPSDHRLRQRVHQKRYTLLPTSHKHPPPISRPAFTAAELQSFKLRRRSPWVSDPDDASKHLQRSQLVQMWNAEYDSEAQWAEYDAVQKVMEEKKEESRLPERVFDSEANVARKRKRVISKDCRRLTRRRARTIEDDDVEDGEILTSSDEHDVADGGVSILRSIEEDNEKSTDENLRLKELSQEDKEKIVCGRTLDLDSSALPPTPPTSPPECDNEPESDLEVEVDDLDIDRFNDEAMSWLE